MQSKYIPIIFGLVIMLALIGCQSATTNETPETIYPPSQVDQNMNNDASSLALTNTNNEPHFPPSDPPTITLPMAQPPLPTPPTTPPIITTPIPPTTPEIPETVVTPPEPPRPIPPPIVPPPPLTPEEEKKLLEMQAPTKITTNGKAWHIRTISLPTKSDYYYNNIVKVQKFLEGEKFENVVVRKGSNKKGDEFWVVDVGNLKSPKDQESIELLNKIRTLKMNKLEQFKGAFFVEY